MENGYQWYYGDTPDLSGHKSILYYLKGDGIGVCPAKEFFNDKDKEEIGNWTWEKECNKLKSNFNSKGKLFYCYFPDYYFNENKDKVIKLIDDMGYQDPENEEDGCFGILEDGGAEVMRHMYGNAYELIKCALYKNLSDEIAKMCEFFLFELAND